MQEKLRKYQDDLRISGLGVIAFAIWSLLKLFLGVFLMPDNNLLAVQPQEEGTASLIISLITAVIVVGIDLVLRLYVGRSAGAESAGKKKGNLYIVVTILLALGSAIGLAFVIIFRNGISFLEIVATFIFEGSSIFILIRLLVSAFRVRAIRKNRG